MAQRTKPLKPVYLIYGEELLIEEALERLKNRLSEEGDFDFNYDEFQGGQDNATTIVNALLTVSFSSGTRLIIVKEAEKLAPSDISKLKSYAENPPPAGCLVLVAEKVKKTSKLFKELEKAKAEIHEYKAPRRSEYPTWIKNEFEGKGKRASDETCEYLYKNVGEDLLRLRREIEKICLFNQEKQEIGIKDTKFLIEKSAEASIWELVDSLGQRLEAKALTILGDLINQGESETHILYMMVRQFRLLIRTKSLAKQGMRDFEVARELRQPSFVVQKLSEQASNFSFAELIRALELLLKTEISIKTGEQEPRLALEMLVHDMLA